MEHLIHESGATRPDEMRQAHSCNANENPRYTTGGSRRESPDPSDTRTERFAGA